MPGIKNVTKHLLTQEDIAYGEGTVDQTRGGIDFELNKVRTIVPVNSLDELNALDVTKFLKAVLFTGSAAIHYSYYTGAWHIVNETISVAPNYYVSEQRFQDFTTQTPTGLDTPLVVKYGSALISPNGLVSVTADGVFRVLKAGPYLLKSNLRVSRVGTTGVSHVFLWVEVSLDNITYVPANVSIRIAVDDLSTDAHLFDTSPIFLPKDYYIRTMVARSSTGNNSGGLYSEAPSVALAAMGVGPDPSASLEWHSLNGYLYT